MSAQMTRLSDLPELYAVVVILPAGTSGKPVTVEVNGRIAKFIAWMIDHREGIEGMRGGHVGFDCSLDSYTPSLKESFGHERVRRSEYRGSDMLEDSS